MGFNLNIPYCTESDTLALNNEVNVTLYKPITQENNNPTKYIDTQDEVSIPLMESCTISEIQTAETAWPAAPQPDNPIARIISGV